MTHADTVAGDAAGGCEIRNTQREALQARWFYENTQPHADVIRTRIRDARRARRLSQAALAQAMTAVDFPMDKSAISRIESGKRDVYADELFAFANVLDVPLVRLVSPGDGELDVRFGGIGLARHEVGNWLVWGSPWSPEARSARRFMLLTRQVQTMRQVAEDERDPEVKKQHLATVAGLVRDLWQASGIRPGVMRRRALRDAMGGADEQDAPAPPK